MAHATVGDVTRRVQTVEGFDVSLRKGGNKVRCDKWLDVDYDYKRAASNKMTVSQWKRNRLCLEDVEVEVLDNNGEPVHGRKTLRTVRDGYNQ
jgi:hypothetical protein